LDAVLIAFKRISRKINAAREHGRRTEFIFYYSGHGDVADGEGFIVLENRRFTRTNLLEKIVAQSPAHANHVIIDACKSYYMIFNKGPGGVRRPFNNIFDVSVAGRNLDRTGFVLSASSHEDSHEWERFQAGVFSYEVRSALRGAADADQDGRITYGELGAFVTTANKGILNPKLRPNFMVSPPGRIPKNLGQSLLKWNSTTGGLMVDTKTSAHFYVETPSGIRIADFHPADAQQLILYLPRSRPLFVRRANNKEEGVLNTDKMVRLSTLPLQPSTIIRKGALNVAFESLFFAPFGAGTVTAYKTVQAERYVSHVSSRKEMHKYSRFDPLRKTLFGTTIGALFVGGAMSIMAFERLHATEDAAQVDIPDMNRTIDRYNTAAVVLYGVAAATGISWLTLKLWKIRGRKRAITFMPFATPYEFSIGLGGRFGD
jgi:hypothetical protein